MVTITLGTLGVTKTTSRGQAMLKSACYLAGIVITFTALGLFFSLTGKVFGSFMGLPAVNIAIAAVFVLLAAGSFELYEPRLPGFITARLAGRGGRGWLGALAAGMVAGFIAVPCIGPVLAGILAFVAVERDAIWGTALLAAYALGFGLPFFLVGVFALRLPRSGPWVRAVKSVFGLALLFGAFWFLRAIFPVLQIPANLNFGIALIGLGLVLGAIHLHFDGDWRAKVRKLIGIKLVVLGGILILNHVLLIQSNDWCIQSPNRDCLTETCASNKTTVVVFSATWCPYCQMLEKETLADPQVQRALAGFGRVHVDTDENPALSEKHGIRGIPAILFFDGSCQPLPNRIVGFATSAELLEFLEKLDR
jgi:thiol:disulfide interchange protein DsbD